MIPAEFIVFERKHWVVNYRMGSTYPGYLMVASRQSVSDISELETPALEEMGKVLADVERAIRVVYNPYKVLVGKLGFTKGFNCHFHVVPVHAWVLEEIKLNTRYADEPDGNDVMLYVNREYCENQCPDKSNRVARNEISIITQYFSRI